MAIDVFGCLALASIRGRTFARPGMRGMEATLSSRTKSKDDSAGMADTVISVPLAGRIEEETAWWAGAAEPVGESVEGVQLRGCQVELASPRVGDDPHPRTGVYLE